MDYAKQPLPWNAAELAGLSEKFITSHYDNNYGGAAKRLNAIRAGGIEAWQEAGRTLVPKGNLS